MTHRAGDVIGIIYNQAERTISYTKNGLYLGVAFHHVFEERLFPTVSAIVFAAHDHLIIFGKDELLSDMPNIA